MPTPNLHNAARIAEAEKQKNCARGIVLDCRGQPAGAARVKQQSQALRGAPISRKEKQTGLTHTNAR